MFASLEVFSLAVFFLFTICTGLILMEHLKQKVKDKSLGSCFDEGIAMMDFSNLAKGKVENVLSEEEIRECIGATLRERPAKR